MENTGSKIPFVSQGSAGTKAAYRFHSNPHVDESGFQHWFPRYMAGNVVLPTTRRKFNAS
ncbi:transposase [Pantoea sp. B270]|uniref:transposase DNA-binding-containing protein n=1 Tax=Pantoea sp. B270 TaxID=2836826 RepID=UPI001BFF5B45|nr:transposase [Pantoea sp. B270]